MRFLSFFFLLALLAACGTKTDSPFPTDGGTASSADPGAPVESDEVQQETGNVSYRGVVEPPGISLYMQGTHRLALEGDRFILLEGPAVDLNAYLGEEVEVFGAVRPTVEGGGVILRVERVNRTVARSEAPSSSILSSSSSSSSSSFSPSSFAASSLSAAPRAEADSPATAASSASSRSVSSLGGSSLEQDALVAMMAKEKFSKEQWTQEYCSPHVGFCVPIHRNWWFKSFGATSSSLWHVEVNGAPVENLGDGILLVNVISGDIALSGAADREVRMHGNFAVGYRSFSDNRHFEISAPGELKEAVQYMTENLR